MKTILRIETEDQFWQRAREIGRKMDRKEKLPRESSFSVSSLEDLQTLLTKERIRLVQVVRQKPLSVTALAKELGRDRTAVNHDIRELRQLGIIRLRDEINPGHGRVRLVETTAKKLNLQIAI